MQAQFDAVSRSVRPVSAEERLDDDAAPAARSSVMMAEHQSALTQASATIDAQLAVDAEEAMAQADAEAADAEAADASATGTADAAANFARERAALDAALAEDKARFEQEEAALAAEAANAKLVSEKDAAAAAQSAAAAAAQSTALAADRARLEEEMRTQRETFEAERAQMAAAMEAQKLAMDAERAAAVTASEASRISRAADMRAEREARLTAARVKAEEAKSKARERIEAERVKMDAQLAEDRKVFDAQRLEADAEKRTLAKRMSQGTSGEAYVRAPEGTPGGDGAPSSPGGNSSRILEARERILAEKARMMEEMTEKKRRLDEMRAARGLPPSGPGFSHPGSPFSTPYKGSASTLTPLALDGGSGSEAENYRTLLDQERHVAEAKIRSERTAMMELMQRERNQMEERMATEKGEYEAKLAKTKEKKARQRDEKAQMETEINSTLQMMQQQLMQQQQLAMGMQMGQMSPGGSGLISPGGTRVNPGLMTPSTLGVYQQQLQQHAAGAGAGGGADTSLLDPGAAAGGGAEDPPTPEEIQDYAVYLGMDAEADTDLFYIAEWALTAPLPEGWSEHSDASGNEFYYNAVTGVSTYEHPLDEQYRTYYRQIKAKNVKEGQTASIRQQAASIKDQLFQEA